MSTNVLSSIELEAMTQKIVDHIHPLRVWLFGSYAQGTATPESDVDWYVEVEDGLDVFAVNRQIQELFIPRTIPMDFLVRTASMMEKNRKSRVSFYSMVIKETGKILYERN
jgi:predicted nucleotidyltransferase